MKDLIERQAAIRKLKRMATQAYIDKLKGNAETIINCCIDVIERQIPSARPEPCEDAVSREAVYDAMVEKGQRSRRYKLGEIWELNGEEIREALDTVLSVTPKPKNGGDQDDA